MRHVRKKIIKITFSRVLFNIFILFFTFFFLAEKSVAQQDTISIFELTGNNTDIFSKEWNHILPENQKAYTNYTIEKNNNELYLKLRSGGTGSLLEKKVDSINVAKFPIMEWTWMISKLPDVEWEENTSQDDFAVRIELVFDYKGNRYNPLNIIRKGFITTFFRRSLPEVVICYVWAAGVPVGRSYISPSNKRIIVIPVESGHGMQNIWIEEERNIQKDFDELIGIKRLVIKKIRIRCDTENSLSNAESGIKKILLKK